MTIPCTTPSKTFCLNVFYWEARSTVGVGITVQLHPVNLLHNIFDTKKFKEFHLLKLSGQNLFQHDNASVRRKILKDMVC